MTTQVDTTPRRSSVRRSLTLMYGAISYLNGLLGIGQVSGEVIP